MEQSLNRIWNPLSAELSIQGQREEGSLGNPKGTTLPPAVKLPLLYFSFPGMQARYESFSDVGEIRIWFASKILTPCRMH